MVAGARYARGLPVPLVLPVHGSSPGRCSLSEAERRRFDLFLNMMMRAFKRDYYFAQDGAINESSWQGDRHQYLLTLQQPGAREWWSESAMRG